MTDVIAPADSRASSAPANITVGDWLELKTRVIALETLLIALLRTASEEQRTAAREMAEFILPRPGATHHRLTVHAAHRIRDLIERAQRIEPGKT